MSRSSTALAPPSKVIERPAPSTTPAIGKLPVSPLQDSPPQDSTDQWIQRSVAGLNRMAVDPAFRRKVARGRR